VTAFDIKVIEDFNEVTHHFLESIWVHLKNTKSPAAQMAVRPTVCFPFLARSLFPIHRPFRFFTSQGGGGNGMNVAQPNFGSQGMNGGGQAIMSTGGDSGGLDNVQEQVIASIKSGGDSESGVSIQTVTAQLAPQGVTEAQIRYAINP
jgi:hypothetical protein